MKKKPVAKNQTLEEVLPALRRGRSIRRRSWVANTQLCKMGRNLTFGISDYTEKHQTPFVWRPYSDDLLASDWEIVK